MKVKHPFALRRRALKINQDPEHPLYLFSLTGDEILKIADISRISRNDEEKLIGYQRREVKKHIQNIVNYLESDSIIFPNSVILALSSSVIFTQSRGPQVDDGLAITGTLEIPIPQPTELKPAWIVDGQQRTLALAQSKRKGFPVPISAFIADNVDLQRDQFLRINTTKPLPRGLINELLPEVSTILPSNLAARKVPSALCEMLNTDSASPFRGLIKRASRADTEGVAIVADTVVIQMLQESFSLTSGVLFPLRNLATGVTDFQGIRSILITYWNAVRDTFPEAWGIRPEKSRLMHSVGILAMGRLMDRVMVMINPDQADAYTLVRKELEYIRSYCRWTGGVWEDLGGIQWNELQNVPNHIRMLANFLVRTYISTRRDGK